VSYPKSKLSPMMATGCLRCTRLFSHEQGISLLFDDRADEAVVYESSLQSELGRRGEKPDRIYGLRKTKRIERLLSADDKRQGSDRNRSATA
jgi:hypothetical protein